MTLNIAAGKEQAELPGLLVCPAPKGCDRNRSDDLLVAYLHLIGGNVPTEAQFQKVLQDVAATYFNARGSVTAGLRTAIEDLNNLMLTGNLKNTAKGIKRIGQLTLMVIRRDTLYLAQAGQTRAFLLSGDEAQLCNDPTQSGRSLGLSRNINIQYHQSQILQKDILLLSPNPPRSWELESLAGSSQMTFDQLRRRLMSQAGEDLQAAVIQFKPGKGMVHRLKPRVSSAEMPVATPAAKPPVEPVRQAEGNKKGPDSIEQSPFAQIETPGSKGNENRPEEIRPPSGKPGPTASVSFVPPRHPVVEELVNPSSFQSNREPRRPSGDTRPANPENPIRHTVSSARSDRSTSPGTPVNPIRQPLRQTLKPQAAGPKPPVEKPEPLIEFRKKAAPLWFSTKTAVKKARAHILTFLHRLLPTSNSQPGTLSKSTLLFISIAVPLVIAAIATTIYTRGGWKEQHYLYLREAQKIANQAVAQKDITLQSTLWKKSQEWLEKAEKYGNTDESQTLHKQVQQAVDRMEGVLRLDLVPALSMPFAKNVVIKDMAVSINGDIYLLNKSEGNIFRLLTTARGYELDSGFNCGPGIIGTLQVGPLVDLVSLDFSNQFGAAILATDARGSLLYCTPGKEPVSKPLPETGGSGWSNITAITRDTQLDLLYVADTDKKTIVYFDGYQSVYEQEPHYAFDNYTPIGLDQTADIAFNEDLFILYANSRVAWCTQRNYTFSAAECEDPAAFGDMRPNRKSDVAIFPNAKFSRVLASDPPDPALYMVEEGESSIYLFSLKLNLQYLLKPQFENDSEIPKSPITAFTIVPGRIGVLAFGNQIYTTALP